jgi:hypothetical protein
MSLDPQSIERGRRAVEANVVGKDDRTSEASCRFFLCARCQCQSRVCRSCDRGQMYCSRDCSQQSRRENQRKARARHQASDRGRAMQAARNRQYRQRHRRMTDHDPSLLPMISNQAILSVAATDTQSATHAARQRRGNACLRCANPVSEFVRLGPPRPTRRATIRRRSRCRQLDSKHNYGR